MRSEISTSNYAAGIAEPKTRKEKKGSKHKGKKEKEEGKEEWVQAKLEFGEEEKQGLVPEEQEESQEQKKLALTPILPIVFYHGTQEWQVPLGFQDIFLDLPALLVPYVPNFQYFLYDLTTISEEQIKGDLILQVGLLSLKYARSESLKDKLKKIFELIDQLGDPQKIEEYLGTVVRYLWSTSPINREEINTALAETFSKEGDSVMKTIAQTYIDQGYEQGRQEMEKEIQKVRQEMAQKAQQEIQKVRQEAQAKERQGLLSSIELGLELKFGKEGLRLFNEVKQIQEMSLLSAIRAALKFVSDLGELRSIYQPAPAGN